MAVFPDRIVLKNSTDSQAAIEAAIQTGGTDEITQGEIVLGLEVSSVSLYTKASDGSIVRFAPGTAAGRAIVSDTAPTVGINSLPLVDGDLWYESDTGSYYVYYQSSWVEVSGGGSVTSIDDLSDVDTTTVAPTDGQVLIWNNVDGEWQPDDLSVDALSDVDTTTAAPVDGQALVWNNSASKWEPGGVSGEIEWTLTANGTTDYIFAGAGFAGTETDPAVYVMRGQTYRFTNGMGAHPFQIQSTQGVGGTAYNDGITNNAVSSGTLVWEVRMDAPSTLYYQCTSHADMNGTIYVLDESGSVASIDNLSDVDTTTVAPTDGQALVWDNANSKWEPGTISGNLPSVPAGGRVLASTGSEWAESELSALLTGGVTAPDVRFNFEGSGDIPTLTSTGMTSTFPSTDAKFGSGGATFLRSNADYLQGSWPQTIGTQTFTLSFWFKSSDTDYSNTIGKRIIAPVSGTNLSTGFQIMRESAGSSIFTPHSDNAKGAIVLSPGGVSSTYLVSTRTLDLTDGAWHYIVIQHEGNGTYSCFADGSLTERRVVGSPVNFADNGGFFIGKRQDNSANAYFTGSIDNLILEIGSVLSTGSTVTVPTAPRGSTVDTGSGVSIDALNDVDTTTVPPTDGQVLVWDNANSKWEPGTVAGGTVASIDDIGDVDTTTSAPSDGQTLVWNNTASQWEPADLQGAAVRAALGIGEYVDDAAAGTGGVASGAMYYNTTSSDYRLKT